MSVIVRHKIRGLEDWVHLKYPEIHSKLTSFGLFVWHRGDLSTLELARVVSNNTRIITFIELFGPHCYIVSHSGSSSSVQSFHISSISMLTYTCNKDRIISIEHLDSITYLCGTDSNQVQWIQKGIRVSSFRVFETDCPQVLSLKHFILNEDILVACGLSNGQVKLINKDGSKDSLPRMEDTGKIVSIELVCFNNKNYFILFSESPAGFKVIANSDDQTDYYEHFASSFEGNPSLLEMSCLDGSCVFILTLNVGVLCLFIYTGGREINLIYQSEMDIRELRDVLCFAIPELSLFHTPKETGCDLCMVISSGSEIQTLALTSSNLGKIAAEISENCTESSIWQKPDLLNKVIREFAAMEEAERIDSDYTDEDLKIMDILVGLDRGALISDFLLRGAADNYLLQDEYVQIIENWVKNEVKRRKNALINLLIPSLLDGEEESIENVERCLSNFLEYEKISNAVEKRTKIQQLNQEISKSVFICRIVIWLKNYNLLNKFEGLDWNSHRKRLSTLPPSAVHPVQYLNLDLWALDLPEEVAETIRNEFSRYSLINLLINCTESQFTRLLLYFLFELEHVSLEAKSKTSDFVSDFFVDPLDLHYVRGFWCLDTCLHPKVVPIDNRSLFDMYSGDALYELAKVTEILTNSEKLQILRFFFITSAVEQAVHWLLVSDLDWNLEETVESAMAVLFSRSDQVNSEYDIIRAYALITLVKDQVHNPASLMKIFSDKVKELGKAHKLPNVSFETSLQKYFLDNLPDVPEIKFFTFLANQMIETAFLQPVVSRDDLITFFIHLEKCFKIKKDLPRELTFVDYKGDIDEGLLRNLSLQDNDRNSISMTKGY